MAVQPFDRTILNPRERPLSSDINQMMSQVNQTVRESMRGLFLPHPQTAYLPNNSFTPYSGFLGDGLIVLASAGMTVQVQPGLGYAYNAGSVAASIDSISGLDDNSPYYPVILPAALNVTLDAAPSAGQERYDIIEVNLDRRRQDSTSRDVLDTGTGIFTPTLLLKTLAYFLDSSRYARVAPGGGNSSAGISYKVGTAATAGSAVPPATTANYQRLATIYVGGAVASIAQNVIADARFMLGQNGLLPFAFRALHTLGSPDTIVVQATPSMPPGMRVFARILSAVGGVYEIKFYVVCGGHYTFGKTPIITVSDQLTKGSAGAPVATALGVNMTNPAYTRLTATERALMDANAQAQLFGTAAAYGQDYVTFTALPVGSDGGPWVHNIIGTISFQ